VHDAISDAMNSAPATPTVVPLQVPTNRTSLGP